MNLVSACIAEMRSNGIDQWDDLYPDRTMIETDVLSGSAFLSMTVDGIAGMVVLNDRQEPEYAAVPWAVSGRVAVVHRLMVAPAWERRGVARALMHFVEARASMLGYGCIRLDVFCQNPRAMRFYEQAGYRRAGRVRFRKGLFDCLEKSLRS